MWSHVSVSDLSFAYVARAPSSRKDTPERLRYFARYLEHDDDVVAEDAYQEFGHSPFDKVAEAADELDQAKLRAWLSDENVRDYRKGFYGVALGLAKSADDRKANQELIRKAIDEQSQDFIAGFDGVLGGYLLLAGERGLKHLEERYLGNPKSADGHVRHTLSALRFCHEYGRDIPRERLSRSLRLLLDRPEFAAPAIVDLARWQDWHVAGPHRRALRSQGIRSRRHQAVHRRLPARLPRGAGGQASRSPAADRPQDRGRRGKVHLTLWRKPMSEAASPNAECGMRNAELKQAL